MSLDIESLLKISYEAGLKSYSPYSHFRVGCAILGDDDNVYTGTNVENRSYGATICAEQSAITGMIVKGNRKIKAVAVVGLDSDKILPPCGICRQILSEFSKDAIIIMADRNLNYETVKICDLLPYDSLDDLKDTNKIKY